MNPLSFMLVLKELLLPEGSLYLSTPTRKPGFLRDKEHHFHKFHRNELDALLAKAGFKIVNERIINSVPWHWCFKGFRPILRYLYFNRTLLIELKPS